jgi:hypothetical protein
LFFPLFLLFKAQKVLEGFYVQNFGLCCFS